MKKGRKLSRKRQPVRKMRDLYDVARAVSHEFGFDWHDPRTGRKHAAPARS